MSYPEEPRKETYLSKTPEELYADAVDKIIIKHDELERGEESPPSMHPFAEEAISIKRVEILPSQPPESAGEATQELEELFEKITDDPTLDDAGIDFDLNLPAISMPTIIKSGPYRGYTAVLNARASTSGELVVVQQMMFNEDDELRSGSIQAWWPGNAVEEMLVANLTEELNDGVPEDT